jgi:hypothetical protein
MNQPLPITDGTVWEGSDALILARIRNINGNYLQQSDVALIQLTVYDRNNNLAVVYGPVSLTVSQVVFNSLQLNPVTWTVDATGYNFLYRIAGAAGFPNATDLRVDVIFTLTDATSFPVQYNLTVQPVP